MSLTRILVDLDSRSYDICIGDNVLAQAGALIRPHLARPIVPIVTDETVWQLHGAKLRAALEQAGIDIYPIIRPPGEGQKSFEAVQDILSQLLDAEFDRHDVILAFGGGVIGDLSGFVASLLKRGCAFIQIPTTLLAQVDSAVGGKTGINVRQGKNLVGAFYQPRLVLSDSSVLATLDERQIKAGYAEVLKYALLGDRSFFEWLETKGADVLALDPQAVSHVVAMSCHSKAEIVVDDEREKGRRALLNLGHTFGHALEAEAGYSSDLLHGEAVSAGMEMAFEFSLWEGLCSQEAVKTLSSHLKMLGLTGISDVSNLLQKPKRILEHMRQDKKNKGQEMTLILAHNIGEAFVANNVNQDHLRSYLSSKVKPDA